MMLALYSNQFLPETEEITRWLFRVMGKTGPEIGYLSSAPESDRGYYHANAAYYAHFGAKLGDYNDLEDGYDPASIDRLFETDAIHLGGGNTFRFLFWLRQRGLLPRLAAYARGGGTLIGLSAGSILMTPDIRSAALCGDENEVGLEDLSALGLVPFLCVPHAQVIGDLAEKMLRLSQESARPVIAIRDDQALFVKDGVLEAVGGALMAREGRMVEIAHPIPLSEGFGTGD